MEIRILLEASNPPEGKACLDGGASVAFVGWLGLISALEAIAASTSGKSP